jgi:uncharacterized protein YdhG (YjbR/CyaY superfamily)
MAKTKFASVPEYIASKPEEVQAALKQVRKAVRAAVPRAVEGISYQIPAYTLNGTTVLYFAGWKAHYSIYPASDALVAAFPRELGRYERSKGTIKFPLTEPVPVKLIERMAKFRAGQLTARDTGARGRKTGRDTQLERVRRLVKTLPSVAEKLSHGTPTFFVEQDKGVFAMFADNHHQDGHLAVWVPVREGLQPLLIEDAPAVYYKPPYVGTSGWVGINLAQIKDDALREHLREAWAIVARNRKKKPRATRAVAGRKM